MRFPKLQRGARAVEVLKLMAGSCWLSGNTGAALTFEVGRPTNLEELHMEKKVTSRTKFREQRDAALREIKEQKIVHAHALVEVAQTAAAAAAAPLKLEINRQAMRMRRIELAASTERAQFKADLARALQRAVAAEKLLAETGLAKARRRLQEKSAALETANRELRLATQQIAEMEKAISAITKNDAFAAKHTPVEQTAAAAVGS